MVQKISKIYDKGDQHFVAQPNPTFFSKKPSMGSGGRSSARHLLPIACDKDHLTSENSVISNFWWWITKGSNELLEAFETRSVQ